MAYSKEVRDEAIRLRVQEHRGLADIANHLGISKGTASLWLRGHPLPKKVVKSRQRDNARKVAQTLRKTRGGESHWIHKASQGRSYSTNEKAMIAEAAVTHRATVCQIRVYGSPFDGDKMDWVFRIPETGKMWKVQVKLAKEPPPGRGLPTVSLRCNDKGDRKAKRRYRKGEFDFIVGYDLKTDTCYVWSWEEVGHLQSAVSICPEAEERWDKFRDIAQPG